MYLQSRESQDFSVSAAKHHDGSALLALMLDDYLTDQNVHSSGVCEDSETNQL